MNMHHTTLTSGTIVTMYGVLQVAAEDGGSPRRSGTMVVDVVITDVNDNRPRFHNSVYNAEITENAIPQRNVVVVRYDLQGGQKK